MTWLLWRQHRRQGLFAAAALGIFAIALGATGNDAGRPTSPALQNVVNLTIAVPLLLGLFWGVTAVGRELDTGTHLLAWTQSIPKREWLRGKIIVTLTAAALWGAVLAWLVTWWYAPINATRSRFSTGDFDIQGIVPVAYAVFAASLGLAAGALLRRLLPALATTLAVFVAVRLIVISYVRPNFQSALYADTPLGPSDGNLPNGTWIIGQTVRQGSKTVTGPLGYHNVMKYQPAGRYWTFQYLESALFIGLSALLVLAAVIVVRRQDA